MAYDKFAAVDSSTLLFPPTVRANLARVSPNYIINGAFEINQRAFTTLPYGGYGLDRWAAGFSGGTYSQSVQAFTAGSGVIPNYEPQNFYRIVTSGQSAASDYAQFRQPIEDVRTLAGQVATVSFWAKANSGTPKVAVELQQGFGSGGSPSSQVNFYAGQVTLTTSWARYSLTFTVPSISGKTIGTTANTSSLTVAPFVSAGSDFNSRTGSIGAQNNTFDFWGVQVEAGAVATPFRRNANSLQGELAACQRYYYRKSNAGVGSTYSAMNVFGNAFNTTQGELEYVPPVPMRTNPTSVEFSAIALNDSLSTIGITGISLTVPGKDGGLVVITTGGTLTQFRNYRVIQNNNNAGYIGFSAEL